MYDNPRNELRGIACEIQRLVMEEGYRYKDIAVITGNLEASEFHVKQIMSDSNIPFFLDANLPVKNNPYIDALEHALKLAEDNFSYDSVFALLKSGIFEELGFDDIEKLENFILKTGIRGLKYWNSIWENEYEDTRACFMDIIMPFYEKVSVKNVSIDEYVEADDEYRLDLCPVNIDIKNGVILDNNSLLRIDEAFAKEFRKRNNEQNGHIDYLDSLSDKELAEQLNDKYRVIAYYTPLGMEIGLNYSTGGSCGWLTVTYKDYEEYLAKF